MAKKISKVCPICLETEISKSAEMCIECAEEIEQEEEWFRMELAESGEYDDYAY